PRALHLRADRGGAEVARGPYDEDRGPGPVEGSGSARIPRVRDQGPCSTPEPATQGHKGRKHDTMTKRTIAGIAVLTAFGLTACGGGGNKPAENKEAAKPAESSPATPAAPAADTANAGTITGKVSYTGAAPKLAKIKMDAEPSCAAKHSTQPMTQDVVLNGNGTLRYAIVYLKSGIPAGDFPVPSSPATLD